MLRFLLAMEIVVYVCFAVSAVVAVLSGARALWLVQKEVSQRSERASAASAGKVVTPSGR